MDKKLRGAYMQQKLHAKYRGLRWEFTYEEWLQVWTESDHLHERGRHKGQYVMSRPGDVGPYSRDNVRIVPVGVNIREPWLEISLNLAQKGKNN
jgi:hypothetical protein